MAKVLKKKEAPAVDKTVASDSDYVTLNLKGLSLPWSILIGALIFTAGISSSIYFGLKARPVTTTGTVSPTAAPTATYAASEFAEVTLPYVDGPKIGKDDAKVVIYEFSDLVCPYCQKFHSESYQTILSEYIDPGKVSLVYKHYPLSFHNPAATDVSYASYCVETLYSEAKFFEFQDSFFANVSAYTQNAYDKSNNPVVNLKEKEFYAMFSKLGIDSNKIKTCMKSAGASARLESDIKELTTFQTDIVNKGLSQGLGTPSFVIGVVKNGVLSGRLIEGAYPIAAFRNVIEEQLKK